MSPHLVAVVDSPHAGTPPLNWFGGSIVTLSSPGILPKIDSGWDVREVGSEVVLPGGDEIGAATISVTHVGRG